MKVRVEIGSITEYKCDLLVVNEFEGVKQPGGATGAVDRALGGLITRLTRAGEISGKLGSVTVIHSQGKLPAEKVAVVGLGKSSEFGLEEVRVASAAVIKKAKELKAAKAATIVHGAGIGGLDPEEAARAVIEGSLLGAYSFSGYAKEKEEPDFQVETLILIDHSRKKLGAIQAGAEAGELTANAENATRDLVNAPANRMTPSIFARAAEKAARARKLKFTTVDPKTGGMDCLWAVAKGSNEPPRLIAIEYTGKPKSRDKVALIGKGITFDSGGISIKPSKGMADMKGDMAGAAAVLETILSAADLKIKKNLLAVMPLCENMPSGHATRPGDVVGSLSGFTVEVVNTDAEGRMILADAVTYAKKQGATQIVDVATLTGGCIVALGDAASGVMGNDQSLVNKLLAAAKVTGQKMWQLPIYDEYKEPLKSQVADLKNTGETGKASPSSGAVFIEKFVGDTPWVHLDIAGTAFLDKGRGYLPEGATGVPVRTLIEFLNT